MNFFVTGAAGFLGAALTNRLAWEKHTVRGLDDLSTGSPDLLSEEVSLTRGDINDRPRLWTLLQDVDCVYHLAARVLVPESVIYPREYNHVNVGGTVTLMEAMRDVGVRRVVFISSGAIYGDQEEQPVREDATPHPRSPYAVSKLAAEYYIHTIGALWGIETVCLRVFNAYGPNQQMPPAHAPVIPHFLRQSALNGTLVINGKGYQTRDYVFIDDVIDAMVVASTAPEIDRQTINIGSGESTSVRDLARMVTEITGGSPEIIYNPRNRVGPAQLCADIALARQKLNYKPRVALEEGLQLTFAKDERLRKH
jgi:UDP-glucose 4-epimerase